MSGSRLPDFLVVDDCHLLDETSAVLLQHLAQTGRCQLMLTRRTKEAIPDSISDLWTSGLLERRIIDPLDRTDTSRLVAIGLQGSVSSDLCEALYARTLGNSLFVRELLFAGRESGAIELVDGEWALQASLPVTDRLRELVEVRLGGLTEQARHVAQLVALDEPLELAVALVLEDSEALADAERRAYCDSITSGGEL